MGADFLIWIVLADGRRAAQTRITVFQQLIVISKILGICRRLFRSKIATNPTASTTTG